MSGTEAVALVRDLAFITLIAVFILTAAILAKKTISVVRSIGRITDSLDDAKTAVANELKPAAGIEGFQSGAGIAGSVFRRLRKGDDSDTP